MSATHESQEHLYAEPTPEESVRDYILEGTPIPVEDLRNLVKGDASPLRLALGNVLDEGVLPGVIDTEASLGYDGERSRDSKAVESHGVDMTYRFHKLGRLAAVLGEEAIRETDPGHGEEIPTKVSPATGRITSSGIKNNNYRGHKSSAKISRPHELNSSKGRSVARQDYEGIY